MWMSRSDEARLMQDFDGILTGFCARIKHIGRRGRFLFFFRVKARKESLAKKRMKA